jgi:hypothetical protein
MYTAPYSLRRVCALCSLDRCRSQDLTTNFTGRAIGRIGMNIEIEQAGIEPSNLCRVERVAARLDGFQVERRHDWCHDADLGRTMNVRKEFGRRQTFVRETNAKGIVLERRNGIAHGGRLGAVEVFILRIVEYRKVHALYVSRKHMLWWKKGPRMDMTKMQAC